MITKREAAIVSAYTGILLGSFEELQAYVEELLGRPVWTPEFADGSFVQQVKLRSYQDFITLKISHE